MVCQSIKAVDLLSDKRNFGFQWRTGLLTLPPSKNRPSHNSGGYFGKMLEQARLKAEQQDIKNISFGSKDFWAWRKSLIIVCQVLHHIPEFGCSSLLFHQHLKADGHALIADFKTE